ncbi:hypothetical protein [Clostridium algidicarnis]|uniref:hypothetical protein n=1 Tax=Clostridium algidicarnis TaxID=37659 RepID=UPI001C0E45D3|nr:hypothetical protein [Clostridium algidicarnis]MBU3204821.1 hypothetical protein [Clostridium algidicarnis]MBU3212975.1 hypothetical protein [Clostridium algidicarnis]MBU3223632.1 hypothetical protein [Clostridium algidicarnis]
MLKKMVIILIFILSFTTKAFSIENINIEIFSVDNGSVIVSTCSNVSIQNQVKTYLKNITEVYAKLNPVPDSGYMIKVPLESPLEIKNQWVHSFVDEVVIILPKDESPYLLIFDNKDNPLFFTFKGNINKLLESLNFEISSSKDNFISDLSFGVFKSIY